MVMFASIKPRPGRERWSPAQTARKGRLNWPAGCSALTGERFFRAHDAELVPLRVGQHSPGLSASLPDVDPARPERKQAVDLLIAVRGTGGEVKMHTVLDPLGIGDRHEAHADRRVLVRPDDDLALALGKNLPAKRLRPEPGQAGQVVSVNDNVVKSDRHAHSMRGRPGCAPATRTLLAWTGPGQPGSRRPQPGRR